MQVKNSKSSIINAIGIAAFIGLLSFSAMSCNSNKKTGKSTEVKDTAVGTSEGVAIPQKDSIEAMRKRDSIAAVEAAKPDPETGEKPEKKPDVKTDDQGRQIADLYVSFYSIAYGTDGPAKTGMENFIKDFEQSNNITVSVKKIGWGREGEVDFCFDLSNLNNTQKSTFIKGIKERLSTSELVHIYENYGCRHER